MKHKDNKSEHYLPIAKLLPTFITVFSLCCGLTSIKAASSSNFSLAVILLIISSILDLLDGNLARALNASSDFGAQMDSLSDLICFGVAPSFVMYLWSGQYAKILGWQVTLFFVICIATRLARFNTMLTSNKVSERISSMFFYGVPAPTAALTAIMPIMISIETGINLQNYNYFTLIYLCLIAISAASPIPTFSLKGVKINKNNAFWFFIIGILFMLMIAVETFKTVPIMIIIYWCFIPFSIRKHSKEIKNVT